MSFKKNKKKEIQSDTAKKTKQKGEKNKKKKGKSAQDTIPIKTVYDKGIIETSPGVFTKMYPLLDTNFQICSIEDQKNIFALYGDLLNSIDADVSFEFTINNKNIDMYDFEKSVLIDYRGDSIDEYRDVMNDILKDKLLQGRNNLKRDKYLTIGIKAKNYEEALAEFTKIDAKIQKAIKDIVQLETTPYGTMGRLNILNDIFNLDNEVPFSSKVKLPDGTEQDAITMKDLKNMGITAKDAIAPSHFRFEKDYFEMGDKYARILYMDNLPSFLKSDVLVDISEAPFNMLTSVHFRSMPMNEAVKLVKHKIVDINANVITAQKKAFKNNYSPELISADLQKAQEEAKLLLQDITGRNQKLFFATLIVMPIADSLKQLDAYTKDIQNRVTKHLFNLKTLNYQQEQGFISALPLARNELEIKRLLTTEAASVFIPYSVREFSAKNGFYYGLNAVSKNMILYNRKHAGNANGFILGTPGSGKSFAAKMEIVNAILSTDDDVYIIDPDREYAPLVNLLGGESIRISLGGNNHINPFDMDMQYDGEGGNPLAMKASFIENVCDTIAGGKFGLSATQVSVIDRCVTALYQPYIDEMEKRKNSGITIDRTISPTFEDFYMLLKMQPEQEAQILATSIESYAIGNRDLFSHTTNVNTNSRIIAYDLKDIGNMKELGLQICLNDIWNKTIANKSKGKYTWFFVDEFYLLTQTDSAATFLQQIFKRARKWGGIPTGITQNVEDVLAQPQSRTMLSNSDFIMMLKQAPLDRADLAALLHISPTQLTYVTNSAPGQGLIYTGDTIVPFINSFPTDNALYKAMTTKMTEVTKFKEEK